MDELIPWTILVGYSAFSFIGLWSLNKYRLANPAYWFIVFHWIMAAGSFFVADYSFQSDQLYVFLHFLSLAMFMLGANMAVAHYKLSNIYYTFFDQPIMGERSSVRLLVWLLLVLSVFVTLLYYQAVGFNFASTIFSSQSVFDYSTTRLASYSGNTYYAPGYTNQFKNVLLPVCLSALAVTYYYQHKTKQLLVTVFLGLPFLLYALTGTGQRAFVVLAFMAFYFGFSLLTKMRTSTKYLLIGLVASSFSILTYYYKDIGSETGAWEVLEKVVERLFVVQQNGSLIGFRYIAEHDTVWFQDWWQGLNGLLPGVSGSDIAHKLHEVLYGSRRGTVPLSLVGSAYYNGGILLVATYHFLIGWLYIVAYRRFLSGRRTIVRCLAYGAAFFYLAINVSGSPIALFEYGVFTLIIFLFCRKVLLTRSTMERRVMHFRTRPSS